MPSTYLVTGATGQQGRAVVRHLLAAGAPVRALVRNPAAARALAQQGVELVRGDFENADALSAAMAGVRAVFSVQPLLLGKSRLEIAWGCRVADCAARAGAHLVYTSVLGAGMAPGVPHFASKAAIEQHIRSLALRYTVLQPAAFLENLLRPIVLKGIAKGKLTTPQALDTPQHMVALDDIGAAAAKVMLASEAYAGRTIPLVGDIASTRGMAATLGRVLGREVRPAQLPGIVVYLFLGRDLHKMFRWQQAHGGDVPQGSDELRALHPRVTTFEQWCRQTLQPALTKLS